MIGGIWFSKGKATKHSYYTSSEECISNTEKCVHTPALVDATHRKYVENERVFYHLALAVSAFVVREVEIQHVYNWKVLLSNNITDITSMIV